MVEAAAGHAALAQQVEAIQKSLVREQCWVCWMTNNDAPPPLALSKEEMRLVHHDYLLDLERRGILFAAGPFVDDKGHRQGAGMLIIRAKDRGEAEAIAFAEPYTKAGQRLMTLTPWQRNEGTVNLRLCFADGVLEVDNRRYKLSPGV